MQIDLGSPDVGMPQEILHRPQICPPAQQVRGKRMPEDMRRDALVDLHVHAASTGVMRWSGVKEERTKKR